MHAAAEIGSPSFQPARHGSACLRHLCQRSGRHVEQRGSQEPARVSTRILDDFSGLNVNADKPGKSRVSMHAMGDSLIVP